MPKPPPPKSSKPRTWPSLAYGDGSWAWDAERRCCELRYLLDGKRVRERAATPGECLTARAIRRDEQAKRAERAAVVSTEMTLRQVFEEWYDFHSPGRSRSTCEGYRWAFGIVAPHLGEQLVADVTTAGLGRMFAAEIAKGSSKATITKVRSLLSMVLDHAQLYAYSPTNVLRSMPKGAMPTGATVARDIAWLDRDEFAKLRALLSRADAPTYRRVLLLQLLTGLRPGEAMGVLWTNVELDGETPVLHVRTQLQRSSGTVTKNLKTRSSRRTVQLPADLVTALRAERQAQRERRMAAKKWSETGLVFTTDAGEPLDSSNLRRVCTAACCSAKVAKVSPNGLRHTNGSMLLHRGVGVAEVARHLGHDDIRMLVGTYSHVMVDIVDTAKILDAVI